MVPDYLMDILGLLGRVDIVIVQRGIFRCCMGLSIR